jgi:hypothetical protein
MNKFLAGVVSVSAMLVAIPAIAQEVTLESGFAESDARNGVITDSRGFRRSQISAGGTVYRQPARYGGFGYPAIGGPTIVIAPGTVVVPNHPIIVQPRHRDRGIVIAPTFNFGGGFNSGLCTRTNTVTSGDGTIFQTTTTEPCNF